ncbi:hypothetical protein SLA2020_345150 [Shorea laevis]
MDSLDDLDFLINEFVSDNTSPELFLPNQIQSSTGIDFSTVNFVSQEKESAEVDCSRKRAHNESSCCRPGTKACRERLRREKLNERFQDLSSILEPGRPVKTDKPAIIDDAIRILTQLRSEAQELQETNEKLQEEIKRLKAEKNELREEKLVLKADKERLEQQLRTVPVPPTGFLPAHPAAYHTGANKMTVFPTYSLVPMWQYLPPPARDTSHDHELRPPAA